METYSAGIDVGSTTVKMVVLNGQSEILFSRYARHHAQTQATLSYILEEIQQKLGNVSLRLSITGSGGMGLGQALHIPFTQEVAAVACALRRQYPQTDVAIELGGEDAKIIYFDGGLEERMNGVCAGGTGSFIDQMASLMQTDAPGLNSAAKDYQTIYPIAARCGVFAKSDIQPLINDGATRPDLAASVFQAVVNQTISGLACGKPIRGHVAFLGGPLHFLTELRAAFKRTLNLTEETAIEPENSHLFAAMGAALQEELSDPMEVSSLIRRLRDGVKLSFELKRMPPLFRDKKEFEAFQSRHAQARVVRQDISRYSGPCYLGIDAGSTTTKLALTGRDGQLLWTWYANNQGNPLEAAIRALTELQNRLPETAYIAKACSTGYGEDLMKAAFSLDFGEVETIAHVTAASFFDPQADCVLDIGGQDMKCIRLKNGHVDSILLNEACSSGCGSFLENFANSMGYKAEEFAYEALYAQSPVDLGTRCTVFMNSNVKQAQKEGASVQDISAGLAYSVIRNALFKVIKLTDPSRLGSHIVVQGGTFHNPAVLRAFEEISGLTVVCPDISGVMGAFGAALLACRQDDGKGTVMLPLEDAVAIRWKTSTTHCNGCENHCMLTVNRFDGGRNHITGNRCERGLGRGREKSDAPNLFAYKLKRMFDYVPAENAPRGEIGIPRVLNIWENYPFWHTFLTALGFRVVLSPVSSRQIYALGMETIPSESECYPAKLAHGHAQWLLNQGIRTIFHPSVFYERQEIPGAPNHYNCPMVCAYPENLKNNLELPEDVRYLHPFLAMTDEKALAEGLVPFCRETWGISESETRRAIASAWQEQLRAKRDVLEEGKKALAWMETHHARGIVLAGRPYHVDPEIHHAIPEMINGYGLAVLSEDSLPVSPVRPLRVNDQWVYHSRLYSAAQYVAVHENLELVQLNSFGCGLDAVTTDQVCEILENAGRIYTVLKIDEVNNLGTARIRIRSLLSAVRLRDGRTPAPVAPQPYARQIFTKEMRKAGYTILAPRMSPIHFDLLTPVFERRGYRLEMLENEGRETVDAGLTYVNNDACYPSIITIGQMMEAVLSGRYDTDHLALIMSQTGGCCRASNYIAFIRRALDQAGYPHIPVISLNFAGLEKNPGFQVSLPMLVDAGKALVAGDLLMKCLYRVRPYEKEPGSANRLLEKWQKRIIASLSGGEKLPFRRMCEGIVQDFDALPIQESLRKPRVGIVGEILVKYMPMANNHLVDLLEKEGAEAVVPDLMDFIYYTLYNQSFKVENLGTSPISGLAADWGVPLLQRFCKPAIEALEKSRRFIPPTPIAHTAELAAPFLSIGNQYGEGWFLCGEMAELLENDVPNIVCIQPFGCLPNHVVGKGVLKQLRKVYPQANIAAVDYDPGASEVNQINRIKLMLTQARERMKPQAAAVPPQAM